MVNDNLHMVKGGDYGKRDRRKARGMLKPSGYREQSDMWRRGGSDTWVSHHIPKGQSMHEASSYMDL